MAKAICERPAQNTASLFLSQKQIVPALAWIMTGFGKYTWRVVDYINSIGRNGDLG